MAPAGDSTSLYRRHRPGSFDEVVGQQHVVRTLRNAVESGKVHHAYLFVGSRGTGKTSMAKILARSLNCERGGPTATPCGECESCVTIAAGTSIDVIEMDAASNRSVDDIRDLRERVAYAPAGGHWKVYIVDEAHMLTKEAWNAFLKTLEEPPPNTAFVLATTEAHRVMPTIADRCQRFDFQRPSLEQISEVLTRVAAAERIEVDDGAVAMIARSASGSFRDALGTLDQLVAFGGQKVTLDVVLEVLGAADAELVFGAIDAVVAEDPKAVLISVEQMAESGRDPSQFARDLLGHLRHLLVTKTIGEVPDTFVVTATDAERLVAQADAIGSAALVRTIDELSAALTAVREGDEARMALEIALLKAARPDLDPSTEGLLRRVERLERAIQVSEPAGPVADLDPPPAAGAAAPPPRGGPPNPHHPPADSAPADAATSSPPAADSSAEDAAEPPPPSSDAPAASNSSPEDAAEPPSPSSDAPAAANSSPEDAAAPPPPTADAAGAGGVAAGVPHSGGGGEAASEHMGEAAATGPAPQSSSELSLEEIQRVWPAVLDHLLKTAPALAATFEGARPVRLDDEGLTIGFPANATFNKRKAEAPDKREQLVVALDAVTGQGLRPLYVLLDGEAAEEAPAAAAPQAEGHDDLVKRLKSEFDAEEVG